MKNLIQQICSTNSVLSSLTQAFFTFSIFCVACGCTPPEKQISREKVIKAAEGTATCSLNRDTLCAFDLVFCADTSRKVTLLRKIVYFKMFLEAYGKLEFGSKAFNVPTTTSNEVDESLRMLLMLQENSPIDYDSIYGPIECCWVHEYHPCKLYIPQILGQMIKLGDSLRVMEPPQMVTDLSLLGPRRRGTPIEKVTDRVQPFGDALPMAQDTIKNPDKYIKRIDKIMDFLLIIPEDGERREDYDDRVEFFRADSILLKYFGKEKMDTANNFNKMKRNWNAVVVIILEDSLESIDDENVLVKTDSLINLPIIKENNITYCLCPSEAFVNQPTIHHNNQQRGSGFFITKDVVATNGHVLTEINNDVPTDSSIKQARFILGFDYPLIQKSSKSIILKKSRIFKVDMARFKEEFEKKTWWEDTPDVDTNEDWAVVPVIGAYNEVESVTPVDVSIQKVKEGLELYSSGHPLGLPKKYIYDGDVQKEISTYTFYCSLDMLGGNSGSPVFDAKTHKLVGVLNAGDLPCTIDNISVQRCSTDYKLDALYNCVKVRNEKIIKTKDKINSKKYNGQIVQRIDSTICLKWPMFCYCKN